jgi:ATP-binding cassette, subfamily B, bacterial HlyB/CyaB
MNQSVPPSSPAEPLAPSGLVALCGIAAYYRIAADPAHLAKELALGDPEGSDQDLVRAARLIGLKARVVEKPSPKRLACAPAPALLRRKEGGYVILVGQTPDGMWRIVDPATRDAREVTLDELLGQIAPVLEHSPANMIHSRHVGNNLSIRAG